MPKEQVTQDKDFVAKLGWGNETSVQIGVEKMGDEPIGDYKSVWATLHDRDECNQLIRLVRKARDAAYGEEDA